jgi:hypothetical protein
MSEELKQVIAGLSDQELRALKHQIEGTLALSGKRVTDKHLAEAVALNGFEALLYDACAAMLQQRFSVRQMEFPVFLQKHPQAPAFIEAAQAAKECNAQWFPKQTKVQMVQMTKLYAKLVLQDMHDREQPLVWPMIAHFLKELPAIFDRSFPGYLASGVQHWVQERAHMMPAIIEDTEEVW